MQTSITIDATNDLDIRNVNAIRLNATPVDRYLKQKKKYVFFCLLSEDDARKKWCNLRDQFIKEFKKIPKGKSGDSQDRAATYTGKWQYFKNLIFLKDTVVPRETEGNVPRL